MAFPKKAKKRDVLTEVSDTENETIPVTTTYDKDIYKRLNALRKTKGEMTIHPLIRLAVVTLLESSGH